MSVPEFYDHHEHMPPGVDPERQAGEFNEGPTHALALFLNQLPKGTPSDEQQRTWARAIKAGRVAEQQLRQAVEDGSSLNTDSLAATQEIIEQGHKATCWLKRSSPARSVLSKQSR